MTLRLRGCARQWVHFAAAAASDSVITVVGRAR